MDGPLPGLAGRGGGPGTVSGRRHDNRPCLMSFIPHCRDLASCGSPSITRGNTEEWRTVGTNKYTVLCTQPGKVGQLPAAIINAKGVQ